MREESMRAVENEKESGERSKTVKKKTSNE